VNRRGTFTTYEVVSSGPRYAAALPKPKSQSGPVDYYAKRGPAPHLGGARLGPVPHLDAGAPNDHLKWITLTTTCDASKGPSIFAGEKEHLSEALAQAYGWTVVRTPGANVSRVEVFELVEDPSNPSGISAVPLGTHDNPDCAPKTAIKDTSVPTIHPEKATSSALPLVGIAALALLATGAIKL
jgi:hypothetical protein